MESVDLGTDSNFAGVFVKEENQNVEILQLDQNLFDNYAEDPSQNISQSNMDFFSDEDSLIFFIDLYKRNPVLWDPTHKNFYRKNLKDDAWKDIAWQTGQDEEACRRKIISLLASYRRERAKTKKSKIKGARPYISKWFGFESFKFLERRNKLRDASKEQAQGKPSEISEEESVEQQPVEPPKTTENAFVNPEPRPSKRIKLKQNGKNKSVHKPMVVAKTAPDRTPHSSSSNEITSFGNYLTSKMYSYSAETRKGVQHAIFDILVKADRGFYERPAYLGPPPLAYPTYASQPSNQQLKEQFVAPQGSEQPPSYTNSVPLSPNTQSSVSSDFSDDINEFI